MKKLFVAFGFLLLLASCKKTSSSTAFIQYKADGQQVQISGNLDSSQVDISSGAYYGCYAVKPNGANYCTINGESNTDGILLSIITSGDLQVTTYTTPSISVSIRINNVPYGINNGDNMAVSISRYSNGTIDGVFSASLSDANGNKKMITEGHLNNIKVYP